MKTETFAVREKRGPAVRPYVVPAMFAGGHEEAERTLILVNALMEPLGWPARLDCPETQRMLTTSICHFRMEPMR